MLPLAVTVMLEALSGIVQTPWSGLGRVLEETPVAHRSVPCASGGLCRKARTEVVGDLDIVSTAGNQQRVRPSGRR